MLDRKYYLRREWDHRVLAVAAVNETAKQAHFTLAAHYAANLENQKRAV